MAMTCIPIFSIQITTRNRLEALKVTLENCTSILADPRVECIICDDASTDGTSLYIRSNFPTIKLITHNNNKGLIYNRNLMLATTKVKYAISLDDDSNFLSRNPLEEILTYFELNPSCAVQAFRIYWDILKPVHTYSNAESEIVQGFVGCGHVWRMSAWHKIPKYPEWFFFYGEEDFAAYQLFKIKLEVHYNPNILVHHRVDLKNRRGDKDYQLRLRRSLRAGWYLYFLFLPISYIPRKLGYSILTQIRNKVIKGDLKAFKALLQAKLDLILNLPKLFKNSNRLTEKEYLKFCELKDTKIYWKPSRMPTSSGD